MTEGVDGYDTGGLKRCKAEERGKEKDKGAQEKKKACQLEDRADGLLPGDTDMRCFLYSGRIGEKEDGGRKRKKGRGSRR